uniref:PH domain-containing protein n=2 Tax=Mesocestoides corti TaxID=53468 RepID=A0A5K3FIG7_MESCO
MSKQRKFVLQLSHNGVFGSKTNEGVVPPDDSFSNFKISSISEPVDYEQYLVRNKASIMNDPHRDLVLFPPDDVKIVKLKRNSFGLIGGSPPSASIVELTKASSLARHVEGTCLPPSWSLLQEPFVRFRGSFCDLPKDQKNAELMTAPSEQWYAIDHVEEALSISGKAITTSSSSSSTGRPYSTSSLANCPGAVSNGGATRLWTSARRSALAAMQSARTAEGSSADSGASSGVDGKTNALLLEADVAICSRAEYQSHQRSREAALASGATATNTSAFVGVRPRRRVALRQLTADDLAKLRYRNPSEHSTAPNLPLGMYLIAPTDWGLQPSSYTAIESRDVIFLDAIDSVSPIGRHWLRFDRHSGSRTRRIASDRLESFFSSVPVQCNEVYVCFEDSTCRNAWIASIKLSLEAEQARLRLGYSSASVANGDSTALMAEVASRKWTIDGKVPDVDSLRSSLQRFSQENESFVSHQRQQNRLNLLSVFPDVQIPLHGQASSDSIWDQQKSDLLDYYEHSGTNFPPSLRKFLPECRREIEKRRFLVTCLSLKTGLRASIEDTSGAWEIDNPEPFFVTLFLASTSNEGIRLTEDFCWNPNSPLIDAMFPPEAFRRLPWHSHEAGVATTPTQPPTIHPHGNKTMAPPPPVPLNPHGSLTVIPSKLAKCRSALLSIDQGIRANSLFLVFRVDKVLVGGISQAAEKYMKAAGNAKDAGNAPTSSDLKTGAALHKSMQSYCKLLGRYRMPFAWGARWLFSKDTQVPLFKVDSSKVSEVALLQSVRQLARLLTLSKDATNGDAGKTDVVPLTPAVLETIEKSIKAEVLPIQLHVAVNEISYDIVTTSVSGLVSPQLVAVKHSPEAPQSSQSINLLHVTDFSSDEVVKELEFFTSRKIRMMTGQQPYHAFDPVLIDNGNNRESVMLFGENKRDSMSSVRSDTSQSSSSAAYSDPIGNSSTSKFLRLSSVLSKTASLERGGVSSLSSKGLEGDAEEDLFAQPPLSLVDPYRSFVHTLYVYPRSLNLSVKHGFGRARNLCCFIELRDSDLPDAKPLKVFYTRPSPLQPPFDTWFNTSVLHHDSSPTFLDEAKLCLPILLSRRHHLLFRFYHVRCDSAANPLDKNTGKKAIETPTGFAWLPILDDNGSIISGPMSLPVSQDLPNGYLGSVAKSSRSCPASNRNDQSKQNEVGAASPAPEPTWLDNKRPLFSVILEPVSTMYTLDTKLARFFAHCSQKLSLYTTPASTPTSPVSRAVRFITADDRSATPSESLSLIDMTTGKLLSNAIKSLLLVESSALVQFFPALANQILEVILISSAMGQVEISTRLRGGGGGGGGEVDESQWLTLCQDMNLGGPCDLAKTAVGTFSVLLCVVKDALCGSTSNSTHNYTTKPALLKDFIEFSLDPYVICSTASETYTIPSAGSSSLFLHHAVVRGIVSLLVDVSSPSEIAHRFFVNAWFFFGVVIKSLAQHLHVSNRIKMDRKDWNRLSPAFLADLTVLIRLLGKWMVELCCDRDGHLADGVAHDTPSTRSGHAASTSSSVASGDNQASDNTASKGARVASSKAAETLGVELADSTAQFLEQLLLLIDRGFVLRKLRDLLTFLEIRHNMSAFEVDRFNCIRYRLLQRFSETQFFVQINLPSLSPYLSDRREEFSLSERFREEHFIVGLSLQQVSCVLAGCADAGGWSSVSSSRVYRQPLLGLLAQLAKLTFDPRYSTASKRTKSRIFMLYLPLIKIALENIASLGPPGLQLKSLRQTDNAGGAEGESVTDSSRHHRAKGHKLHKIHNKKHAPVTSRPNSLVLPEGSDGSVSSMSLVTTSSIASGDKESCTSADRRSAASSYIGANGKVAPEVLKQIAGFNQGGSLHRVVQRRRAPCPTPQAQFGSTATLTESADADIPAPDDDAASDNSWTLNGVGDNGSYSSTADYNSDIDENDDAWAERVLEVAGILPTERKVGNGFVGKPSAGVLPPPHVNSCPPPPSRPQNGNSRRVPLRSATPSADSVPPSARPTHFNMDLSQFDCTFRPHIHRRLLCQGTDHHLNDKCQRDLYVCLLHLLSNLTDEPTAALLRNLNPQERCDFLKLLTFAIRHLKYRGLKCIARFSSISACTVAQRGTTDSSRNTGITAAKSDGEYRALLEANLVTEAGLIVLDTLNLVCNTFRRELECEKPSSALFQGILDVYVCLLTTGQSEVLLKHTFSSLRVFISRFARVLFAETTDGLARLCMAALRTSNLNLLPSLPEETPNEDPLAFTPVNNPSGTPNSRCAFDQSSSVNIGNLRLEACGLIYRMWRSSFEVFGSRGFQRVHLQMIISLSKLVGDIGPEFETSLSLLHSLTEMDIQRGSLGDDPSHSRSISQVASLHTPFRGSSASAFIEGIEDLIKRIRTVLTATDEMRTYGNDPYRKIDLQYSLAKSYASNPVLRRTWLEKLAELHLASKNMAEVAMAKLHIAALMAEYLHKRGEFPEGCDAFCKVSANIRVEEACNLCDPAILELSYNQEDLLKDVTDAAMALEAAGLYEALQPVYALITPVYETRRDFLSLARIYHHLGRAYENTAEAEASVQRLFATYFRVSFYGKAFESLAGKSFVYRTEACQKLNVFLQSQVKIHEDRLGVGRVEKITENYVNPSKLSPDKAYIQVTFVEPYMSNDSLSQRTSFDLHHDVREFFFETPFIMQPGMSAEDCLLAPGPKRTDDLSAQWKRRTKLTTEAVFPHLRSRLEVVSTRDYDLSPLDSAIDAIQVKVRELSAHIPCAPQKTANTFALHLSTTKNQHGVRVVAASTPNGVGVTSKGERRVPLLLDMQLQGALLPTVNQGPMAYAHAFLAADKAKLHSPDKIQRLKKLFFDFLTTCLILLTRYRSLMLRVHPEKYNALRESLDRYRVELSNLLNEEVIVDEARLQVGPKSQFSGA